MNGKLKLNFSSGAGKTYLPRVVIFTAAAPVPLPPLVALRRRRVAFVGNSGTAATEPEKSSVNGARAQRWSFYPFIWSRRNIVITARKKKR